MLSEHHSDTPGDSSNFRSSDHEPNVRTLAQDTTPATDPSPRTTVIEYHVQRILDLTETRKVRASDPTNSRSQRKLVARLRRLRKIAIRRQRLRRHYDETGNAARQWMTHQRHTLAKMAGYRAEMERRKSLDNIIQKNVEHLRSRKGAPNLRVVREYTPAGVYQWYEFSEDRSKVPIRMHPFRYPIKDTKS